LFGGEERVASGDIYFGDRAASPLALSAQHRHGVGEASWFFRTGTIDRHLDAERQARPTRPRKTSTSGNLNQPWGTSSVK
jgi:hypothetical protein